MLIRIRVLLLPLLTALVFVAALPVSEAHAKKSFFEGMFGWLYEEDNQGEDPSVTLRAPFSYDQADTTEEGSLAALSEGPQPLRYAHTTETEIAKWLVMAVSNSMNYEVGGKPDIATEHSKYFAQSGQQQFRDFLVQNNIQKVIDTGRFNIRSFARERPLLLNSASANDRYRWLYEVPLMVSYMDAKDFNYKEDDPVNQQIILTIQVGRFDKVDDPENAFDVLIETWSGRSQQIEKN